MDKFAKAGAGGLAGGLAGLDWTGLAGLVWLRQGEEFGFDVSQAWS